MSKQEKYKSNFQDLWLQNETFKTWLQEKPGDSCKVRCKVCAKDISVELHGITALFSHADGNKHKERLPKDTPISFLWLPGTIVQNSLVSHLQIIHAPISNSVLVH